MARPSYLRVPQAHFGPIKVPDGVPDERFLYLSDILPTAWQAVEYAEVSAGRDPRGLRARTQSGSSHAASASTGACGSSASTWCRSGWLSLRASGWRSSTSVTSMIRGQAVVELTEGRGADGTVDAVGMEAHGSPVFGGAIKAVGLVPDTLAKPLIKKVGVDRLAALTGAISAVRRGGTVSVSGVYGGMADPMPMMEMFDKGISLRMGQCHVKRWIDDILPVVMEDGDVLGLESLATHRLPLAEAAEGYDIFQKKSDGCVKVVLKP